MLSDSSKKNSTTQKRTLMSTEETREYLNQIYKHHQPSTNVMPERRIMSIDETREYLNHILNKPSASMDAVQAQSLVDEKKQL